MARNMSGQSKNIFPIRLIECVWARYVDKKVYATKWWLVGEWCEDCCWEWKRFRIIADAPVLVRWEVVQERIAARPTPSPYTAVSRRRSNAANTLRRTSVPWMGQGSALSSTSSQPANAAGHEGRAFADRAPLSWEIVLWSGIAG